ncbi:MAG: hypothetical protein RIG82_06495 [Phycisphaeraceae bacterium]
MSHRYAALLALWLVVATCTTSPTSAGILGDGTRVLDTETGLEYLHSRFSRGEFPGHWLYPNNYPGTYPWIPPTPPGYRPATDAEVRSLLAAVGVAPGINSSLAAYTAIDTLHTFMGHTYEFTVSRFERTAVYLSSTLTPEPWDSNLNLLGYTVRVDENYNHTVQTGSIWRTDGAINGASQRAFLVLVRNTAVNPSAPQTPVNSDEASRSFVSVTDDLGAWYDVIATPGLNISISSDSGITRIGLPASFSDSDNLLMFNDPILGQLNLAPGQVIELSEPVNKLTLTGYNLADTDSSAAPPPSTPGLPLFLTFAEPGSSFTTSIPEPASFASLTLASLALTRRR